MSIRNYVVPAIAAGVGIVGTACLQDPVDENGELIPRTLTGTVIEERSLEITLGESRVSGFFSGGETVKLQSAYGLTVRTENHGDFYIDVVEHLSGKRFERQQTILGLDLAIEEGTKIEFAYMKSRDPSIGILYFTPSNIGILDPHHIAIID